ncbi:uncharacterized protein LOC113750576 [Coffea eugenioides]|uniref:uncharacterized protein LOC113750576 n=1 Tax=Coffea eugenioides TaxID=49369 RepID=UPI000F61050B|nr:uncharacterized protein LOC113750576 [Coffea eugenioides]
MDVFAAKIAEVLETRGQQHALVLDLQKLVLFLHSFPSEPYAECRSLRLKLGKTFDDLASLLATPSKGPNVNRNPFPEHANTIGVILDDTEYVEPVKELARKAEVFGVTDQPFVIELPFEEDEKPFILDLTPAESESLEPVVIEFPKQEPVLSLQQVPWNYDEPTVQIGERSIAKKEVSVVTRSGKIASPFEATIPIQANNSEPPAKPTITEKEALDFLKRLQRSEYNVIEKLSKSPAQISMLDLLFSSDVHRDALIEVLTKAQIPRDISVDNFSHVVGSVLFTKQITFSDEELPAEGIGHNKALYIVVRCNGKMLPKVLIDNGSALNICPWSTLEKLGLQDIKLRPSGTSGEVRVCIDYRDLNKASPKDDFPLPNIHILLDNTAGHEIETFCDCFAGYHQILMAEEDREKTAFITPWGTFCYRVMPFGLKNAGATYQRTMTTLFHDMIHREMEVYVDDIIIKSKRAEDHLVDLKKLFERLRKYNLKLNPAKCAFGAPAGKLLGFIVSKKGIEIDPAKIKAIRDMPVPKTQKDVKSFLGKINFIGRFIGQLTATCEPLFKLLRKNVPLYWNEECQQAFDKIKDYLLHPPVLVPPKPGRPLIMYLSVLDGAVGCVLGQHDESGRKEQAIYYLSKKFTQYEANYSFIEKSCCALAWAAQKLRHYLLSHTTYLLSRSDPLKYLLEKPMLTGRLAKWQIILSEFDIVFTSQKAVKGQAIADHLAENPRDDDYQPLRTYFPDERVLFVGAADDISEQSPEWRLFFDGASNSLGAGIGAVLVSPEGKHYPAAAKLQFACTNNMAEYEACIFGLKMALEMEIKELIVFSDSDLLVNQTLKQWITKDSKILPYHCSLLTLAKQFQKLEFRHLPRARNAFADALATLASMIQYPDELKIEPIQVQLQDKPAHCWVANESSDNVPWYSDLKEFLKTGSYPLHAGTKDKNFLRRMASKFFLNGEVLYKRTSDLNLLRCIDEDEAQYMMKEVHSGVCGPHMNGHLLAKKIMRTGYFWLTMEHDCIDFVRRCIKCQMHGDIIRAPPTELHSMTAPWPCSMWGMDVIGTIDPPASNGHRFILVAIEYFTKWVEAESFKHVTKKVVANFLRDHIICRFGVPETLITDNAKNLNNDMVDGLCEQFKIKHRNSAIYRPQMNGAVEAANKNLKKIIRKMTEKHRDWHEKLPYALMAYRTSIRTSTGATPYSLMYGMEAVLPAEVEIPSLRILTEAKLEEADWIKQRHEQLTLIDEKRFNAICHGQCYQKRVARAYNKKVHRRAFEEGDKVLKRILSMQDEAKGKFAPNWQGPFIIQKVLPGGALILAEMDGRVFPQPINSDMCKKFFI